MVIGKVRQRLENTIGLKIFSAVGEKGFFFAGRLKCFNLLLLTKTLYLFLNSSSSNDCSLSLKTPSFFWSRDHLASEHSSIE